MLDWNDLRSVAEVVRSGSLAAAARRLGVHATTVARRIQAAEDALGCTLFLRKGKSLHLTSSGASIMDALGPLLDTLDEVTRRVGHADAPFRVATTENTARILAERALPLLLAAPQPIDLEILAGNAVVDLARGDVDLAVRVIEPDDPALIRKRIGTVRYGLYASREYLETQPKPRLQGGMKGHRLLMPGGELAQGPEAKWLREHAYRARIVFRSSSLVALALAAEQDAGLVVLPTNLALFHTRLQRLHALNEIPGRSVWLVMHGARRRETRLREVAKIVEESIRSALEASEKV